MLISLTYLLIKQISAKWLSAERTIDPNIHLMFDAKYEHMFYSKMLPENYNPDFHFVVCFFGDQQL